MLSIITNTNVCKITRTAFIVAVVLIIQACGEADLYQHNTINQTLLKLHNNARLSGITCTNKKYPTAPKLKWNTHLAGIAFRHSQDNYEQKKLSHLNQSGQSTVERINSSGYQWLRYGENLASGVYEEQAVFQLWLNSQQHCKNIANSQYTDMGAAQVNGYWTAIYASPK